MTTMAKRGSGWLALAALWTAALWLPACAGKRLDGGTDTNTNWLGRCDEIEQPCTPLPGDGREKEAPVEPPPAPDLDVPAPGPGPGQDVVPSMDVTNPFEFGTVDSCVVRCDTLLPGRQCIGLDALPDLRQTLLDWQGPDCSLGALLEGSCEGGTRFLWRGGAASEVRYFTADGGFIGLSAFSSQPDPSTCNGVRRWPQQVACNAPSVTRELCPAP